MSLEIAPTYPAFLSAGDTALVVQYGEVVDVSINRTVRQLAFAVRKLNIKGVVDIVPTMRSLMIHYDPLFLSKSALIEVVTPLLSNLEELEENNKNWLIPVCYEDEFAPDINDVSKVTNTTIDEIVRQHTLLELEVFMMGFLPCSPDRLVRRSRDPTWTTGRSACPPRLIGGTTWSPRGRCSRTSGC